jgi:hypothetical protein
MMRRRDFLKATAVLPWTLQAHAAAATVGPMKITKVDVVHFRRDLRMQGVSPNWTWVRLHTDAGITGLGESYPNHNANVGAPMLVPTMPAGRMPASSRALIAPMCAIPFSPPPPSTNQGRAEPASDPPESRAESALFASPRST